jgi:thioredoxin-like negative regulator of GroEL
MEEGSYDELVELAKELLTTHDEDDALYELMKTMKSDVEEMAPDIRNGLYSALMWAGIGEINYYEIARHILDDAKFEY